MRGVSTSMSFHPSQASRCLSPEQTILALAATAHARNTSSSASSQTCESRGAADTIIAWLSMYDSHASGSIDGNFFSSRPVISRYSDITASEMTSSNSPLCHAVNTFNGTPPKKTADMMTFVSSTARISLNSASLQRASRYELRVWLRLYRSDACLLPLLPPLTPLLVRRINLLVVRQSPAALLRYPLQRR